MRRTLGTLLLLAVLAVLAACGDEGAGSEPVGSAGAGSEDAGSEDAGSEDAGSADVVQRLVSGSAGGGVVDDTATPLPDEEAVATFVRGLDDALAAEVVGAAAELVVPDGQELYGAVVAIGCTPPGSVTVTGAGDDVVVMPRAAKQSPEVQCLVPVTTVALVTAQP